MFPALAELTQEMGVLSSSFPFCSCYRTLPQELAFIPVSMQSRDYSKAKEGKPVFQSCLSFFFCLFVSSSSFPCGFVFLPFASVDLGNILFGFLLFPQ